MMVLVTVHDVSDVLTRGSAHSSRIRGSQYVGSRAASLFVLATCKRRCTFFVDRTEGTVRQGSRLASLRLSCRSSRRVRRRHRHQQRQSGLRSDLESVPSPRRTANSSARPSTASAGQAENKEQDQTRTCVFTFHRLALPIIEIAFGCYMASVLHDFSIRYQCGIYYWHGQSAGPASPSS